MKPGGVIPAADEIDDFDLVAIAHQCRGKRVPLDDDHVVLDRDTPGIDVQPFEQFLHRHRLLEIIRIPVERNPHGLGEFYSTETGGWARGGIRDVRNVRNVLMRTTNDPNDPNDWNDWNDSEDLVRRFCRLFLLGTLALIELRSLHADVDGDERIIFQLSCGDMKMNGWCG